MAIIRVTVGVYDRIHKAVGVVHILDKGDKMIQIMAAVAWACMMQQNIQQKERKPTNQKQNNDDTNHDGKTHFLFEAPMLLLSRFHCVEDDDVGSNDD